MQQDILIIGVLFPAIPIMIMKVGNHYTVLANLIHQLHYEVVWGKVSPNDAEQFLLQISRLRGSSRLIGTTHSCAAMAFMLALTAMIVTYFQQPTIGNIVALCFMTLLMKSVPLFTYKI